MASLSVVSVGKQEPNSGGHFTLRCKTTSCHVDSGKLSFPLDKGNLADIDGLESLYSISQKSTPYPHFE